MIGSLKPLSWGEYDSADFYHSFRTYPKRMQEWIKDLKEGQSAFENAELNKKPHRIVGNKIVLNVSKNGDKYKRQKYHSVAPCIHTRNDQMASQNTIHPKDDRVFSIRELMLLMNIPSRFRWLDLELQELNALNQQEKEKISKQNEMNIRQSIGEAVPTIIFTPQDLEKRFPKIDKDKRRYTTVPIHAPGEVESGECSKAFKGMLPPKGRHWRTDIATLERWDKEGLIEYSNNDNPRKKIYALEQAGKRVQDIWEFKDPQYPSYPTEKNAQLLDLIIKTSSNKDSIVLDCFCGSGTTLKSAFLLQRKFIGIDNSSLAIKACKNKLETITKDLFVSQNFYDFLVF
ncbi:DNA (cytosine-5-)-methyltransferase [Helicobacter pylori GAM114Ai]|nr:DNA (cytosine-5-)-methyltransferase [Helicobacter pylori GAM114Ai]